MLSVVAPAKINLFLNVRPRRADGFHEIRSVMQAVALWDRLDVTPSEHPGITFSCNVPAMEGNASQNLVVKAYRLFWQETGLPALGLNVHLEKEIPVQAGLGGGSSDAAAMLLVLNHLSHAGLSEEKLCALAARLGSDVPFFIRGGLALARGRGEEIEPLPSSLALNLPVLIIKPRRLDMSTVEAYRELIAADRYEVRSPDHLLLALGQLPHRLKPGGAIEALESYLFNDFERPLYQRYPELGQLASRMRQLGIGRPLLSGSGSAMLGFAEPEHSLKKAVAEAFPERQYAVFWTTTIADGVTQLKAPV